MQNYREKRHYPRMETECPARFEHAGGGAGGAIVKNLSGGGLLAWVDQEIPAGSVLTVTLKPINDTTPPMVAEVKVVRSAVLAQSDGNFAVACQISRVCG